MEGDFVSLSPCFEVSGNYLVDNTTGARHLLHANAKRYIEFFYKKWTLGDYLAIKGVKIGLTSAQQSEVLLFLNSEAALLRQRSFGGRLHALLRSVRRLSSRTNSANLAGRYPATTPSLILLSVRSVIPIVIAGLSSALLWYGTGLVTMRRAIGLLVVFCGTLLLSLVLHEAVHIVIARRSTKRIKLVKRGLRIGVMHAELRNSQEMLSAVLGPLCGATSALLLGFVPLLDAPLVLPVCLLVASFHLVSWLPFYGDGKTLFRTLSTRKKTSIEIGKAI